MANKPNNNNRNINNNMANKPNNNNRNVIKKTLHSELSKPTIKKTNRIINSNSSADKKVKRLNKLVEALEFTSIKKTKKLSTLSRGDINAMLKSGVFSLDEKKAVVSLIKNSKINTLNENTAKLLDANVSIILEAKQSDRILTEGFFGDIWDGIKGLGDKAKEALKGGWSKVKAIWSEFTDLAKEVGNSILEGFKKFYDYVVGKFKDVQAKVQGKSKELFGDLDHASLKKEGKYLMDTAAHWAKYTKENTADNTKMVDVIAKGGFSADDKPDIDDKKIALGIDNLEKIADSQIKLGFVLNETKRKIMSDSNTLLALIESRGRRIMLSESGGFTHLEGCIKNDFLRGVVHYAILGAQWVMNPVGKIMALVSKLIAKKGLDGLSEGTKLIGGPGAFKFAVIGALSGEIIETIIEYMEGSSWLTHLYKLIPVIGHMLEVISETLHHIVKAFIFYGCATVLVNLLEPFLK